MEYPDARHTIREWLETDSVIAAATSSTPARPGEPRVYSLTLPPSPTRAADAQNQLAPALLLRPASGFVEEVPIYHPRWEVLAFAPRASLALDLAREAIRVLDRESRRDYVRAMYVTLTLAGDPEWGTEPDTGYIFARTSFTSTVQRMTPGLVGGS